MSSSDSKRALLKETINSGMIILYRAKSVKYNYSSNNGTCLSAKNLFIESGARMCTVMI
jgi:hypothetical protein